MTELKKQANRMMFNQAEEEFVDGEDTIGLGVIGKDGSGRLRALALQQRQKLSAKAQKKVRAGAGALVWLRVCVGVGGGGGPRELVVAKVLTQGSDTAAAATAAAAAVCAEELRHERRHQRPLLLAGLHAHPGHRAGQPQQPGAGRRRGPPAARGHTKLLF